MQVYIVQLQYDYEGFSIDSTYAREKDALARAAEVQRIIDLPTNDPEHKYLCDHVDVECLEVIL